MIGAADMALALDASLLFSLMGKPADDWQREIVRSVAQQIILLCSRQAGKTTTLGVLAAHTAVYNPGSLVLWLTPTLRQSQEGFRSVREAYTALGMDAQAIEGESALRVEFTNGSRVVVLPGRTDASIRGYAAVKLAIVDEASRVADELYRAVRPMLAVSGGRLVLASTPWARQGFFFQEWTDGAPADWLKVRITAEQVRRISRSFLESERRSLPANVFAREYMCEFTDSAAAVFSYADVKAMVSGDVAPLWPDLLLADDGPADLLFSTLEGDDYVEVAS